MSISTVSSAVASATSSSKSTSSSSFSTEDFLKLLVEQLQNQNPLDPADTNELLNQMVSYASYQQQAETTTTLNQIASTLNSVASALNITA